MRPWSFIHVTDIHVGSPRSFRYAPSWVENWRTARRQILDIQPDFLLVGGDLTRDGSLHRYELEAIKADLDGLPFPCHVIPGNMDTGNKHARATVGHSDRAMTFGGFDGAAGKPAAAAAGGAARDDVSLNLRPEQLAQFVSVFGPACWSFDHKGVRVSAFCDMVVNSGLPEERDLWQWMDGQRGRPRAGHHVWLMHYALFIDDPHEPNWDIRDPARYHDWYFGVDEPGRSRLMETFKATGAEIVLSGHIHCRTLRRADGIRFHRGPSTAFAQWHNRWPDGDPALGFQRFDVTERGIHGSFVPLAQASAAKGYGPGGHPRPDQRDYSIAWEK